LRIMYCCSAVQTVTVTAQVSGVETINVMLLGCSTCACSASLCVFLLVVTVTIVATTSESIHNSVERQPEPEKIF
jgi:hypothetical protein